MGLRSVRPDLLAELEPAQAGARVHLEHELGVPRVALEEVGLPDPIIDERAMTGRVRGQHHEERKAARPVVARRQVDEDLALDRIAEDVAREQAALEAGELDASAQHALTFSTLFLMGAFPSPLRSAPDRSGRPAGPAPIIVPPCRS